MVETSNGPRYDGYCFPDTIYQRLIRIHWSFVNSQTDARARVCIDIYISYTNIYIHIQIYIKLNR